MLLYINMFNFFRLYWPLLAMQIKNTDEELFMLKLTVFLFMLKLTFLNIKSIVNLYDSFLGAHLNLITNIDKNFQY